MPKSNFIPGTTLDAALKRALSASANVLERLCRDATSKAGRTPPSMNGRHRQTYGLGETP